MPIVTFDGGRYVLEWFVDRRWKDGELGM